MIRVRRGESRLLDRTNHAGWDTNDHDPIRNVIDNDRPRADER